jgi:hypothetical protein
VSARHIRGTAQLEHLDESKGSELLLLTRQVNDAVGNRKFRALREFLGRVLSDEQSGRAPARGAHRQVVHRVARVSVVAHEIVQRFRAVDHQQRGPVGLDPVLDLGQGLVEALRPRACADVEKRDAVLEEGDVEEGELLHEADQLQTRLGQRRDVERALSGTGEREHHLQREHGLARARRPGHHDDRAGRHAAAEHGIEVLAAG